MVRYELKKIQCLKAAGLTSSSPNDPHYVKVLNRENPTAGARHALAGQSLDSAMNTRCTPKPLNKIRHASANTPSVASTNSHWPNDPIHRKVNTMLTENQDMIPEDSIVMKMKLNIPSPEEYSGSPDLEVYKTFIAGIL